MIYFVREALKPMYKFSASNGDFNGFSLFAFFFEMKGYFIEKSYTVILVKS